MRIKGLWALTPMSHRPVAVVGAVVFGAVAALADEDDDQGPRALRDCSSPATAPSVHCNPGGGDGNDDGEDVDNAVEASSCFAPVLLDSASSYLD